MPYVTFRADGTLCFATHSVGAPTPGPDKEVGEVPDIQLDGHLKNFRFVPTGSAQGGITPGRIERKPRKEWDMEAEVTDQKRRQATERLRRLDLDDVARLEVRLMLPTRFARLQTWPCQFDTQFNGVAVVAELGVAREIRMDVGFDDGGYMIPYRMTSLRLSVEGLPGFLRNSVDRRLAGLDPESKSLFAGRELTRHSVVFGLHFANYLVDAYRVSHGDTECEPVGIADVLAAVVTIVRRDGTRTVDHSGISLDPEFWARERNRMEGTTRLTQMQELLASGIPFIRAAVADLEKAYLHGQPRECIVWAGAIINYVIEDILLRRLPEGSPSLKRLRNNPDKVRGATKRSAMFKEATGQTLSEFIDAVTARHSHASVPEVWSRLSENVEHVLNTRNQLLHRKKRILVKEGERAFHTCMNVLYALEIGAPFYSDDIDRRF